MLPLRIVLLSFICLITLPSDVQATAIANFWISQHGVAGVGSNPPATEPKVPRINRLAGSGGGSFYIWARSAAGMNLVNWSLDVRSTNSDAIALTNSWVAPYNEALNSIPTGPNSLRRWEYSEQPAAVSLIDNSSEIVDVNGFSLFGDEGEGIGIGPVNAGGMNPDPWYHPATNSWLIARIDYQVGTLPEGSEDLQSEIFLQIGSRGMSHCDVAPCIVSSTADTEVIFGDMTEDDPPRRALNAATDRDKDSYNHDAVFIVSNAVVTKADFDSNDVTDNRDLAIWRGSYGADGGGDTDGDGDTDGRDLLAWQRLYSGGSTIADPGDFDGDGDVDGRDFLIWQRGGSPNPLSAEDLADWRANFGAGSLVGTSVIVPEPTSFLLAIAACGLALGTRNR